MNKKNPYISIIMPLYNTEAYIEKSLQSIINQTYSNWEIILVNDGSKDQSLNIAKKYLDANNINYVLIDKQNEGIGAARRDGLLKATGKWIIFVDSDDIINKDLLNIYISFINQHNDIDAIFSDFQYVKRGGEFAEPAYDRGHSIFNKKDFQRFFLLRKPPLLLPGTLFKAHWLKDQQSLFTTLSYSEDISFLWKILLHINNVGYIKTPLYNYLRREHSVMSSLNAEKVLAAIPSYQTIQQQYQTEKDCDHQVCLYMFDRWLIGAMKALTHTNSFSIFRKNAEKAYFAKSCRKLLSFPDKRIQLIAASYLINPRVFYYISKIF